MNLSECYNWDQLNRIELCFQRLIPVERVAKLANFRYKVREFELRNGFGNGHRHSAELVKKAFEVFRNKVWE